jgi:hypothetical protein
MQSRAELKLILGKKLKLTKNKKKYGQVPNLKMKKNRKEEH